MQLIHDISSAEEWIKERQDAVDKVQLTNQPIDRSETENRIAVLRKIGNEQQTGESLIHAAIGMILFGIPTDNVYEKTRVTSSLIVGIGHGSFDLLGGQEKAKI